MITRNDYLEGRATHRQYYGEIVKASGYTVPAALVDKAKQALRHNDPHIHGDLDAWDRHAIAARWTIEPALKARGDGWCLGTGVCAAKEAAMQQAEAE